MLNNPLAFAWLSRTALLLRQDDAAGRPGDEANKLVTAQTPEGGYAVRRGGPAEGQRDFKAAEALYRDLASRYPDEPAWFIELASCSGSTVPPRPTRSPLIVAPWLSTPGWPGRIWSCAAYNRLNESASAKQDGNAALSAYRAMGNRGGEAQALMCLTDQLRLGGDEERLDARRDADAALQSFQDLGYGYNVARAHYTSRWLRKRRAGRLSPSRSTSKSLLAANERWECPVAAARTR